MNRSWIVWTALSLASVYSLGSLQHQPDKAANPAFANAEASEDPKTKSDESCGMPVGLMRDDWPRELQPTQSKEPSAFDKKSVSIAVLPDPQYYTQCRSAHLGAQARWIESEKDRRHILATLTLGDLTENNIPNQWEFFREEMQPAFQSTPTILVSGNHDYGEMGRADSRKTGLHQYFPSPPGVASQILASQAEPKHIENAYYRLPITLGAGKSVTLGILSLEWSPRTHIVRWAQEVLDQHPKDRVILLTHAYLYHDGQRYNHLNTAQAQAQEWSPLAYGTARAQEDEHQIVDAYDGERLWQELIRTRPNVMLTISGHVLADGQALTISPADDGHPVTQMLTNFQMLKEGGLGYLRLIEILPDGTTLRMKTFSPSLNQWATGSDQQFDVSIEPPLWPKTNATQSASHH